MKRILILPILGLLMGCAPKETVPYAALLKPWTDPRAMADLRHTGTGILTSHDPTGGNDDFNHPLRVTEEGWAVLADLQGPGYISRFWGTGFDTAKQMLRFYFDEETHPSIETTFEDFFGGKSPRQTPLAAHENLCFLSYAPIPYARRLIIMTPKGGTGDNGWPRNFHQINYTTLPRGQTVVSYNQQTLTAADRAAIEAATQTWQTSTVTAPPAGRVLSSTNTIPAGAALTTAVVEGPGLITNLQITLPDATATAPDILRQLVVRIFWDDTHAPSVEVPLGPMVGSFDRPRRFQSFFFGMTHQTVFCRFPMPFRHRARIELRNDGRQAVAAQTDITVAPPPPDMPADSLGYFHAAWNRSGPSPHMGPHAVLRTQGRGKYVGCLLAVQAGEPKQGFWILESDEFIQRDHERAPAWRGTGLEDYFNGGWYYQNVLIRPFHGLPQKTFFATTQYRLHPSDAVGFKKSIDVTFERGPQNTTTGWFESVAFYYLDRPRPVPYSVGTAFQRALPAHPLEPHAVMTELMNHERLNDYRGAFAYIDDFLKRFPQFPFAPMLRLRQIAYVERWDGFDKAKPLYEKFVNETRDAAAVEQAKLLLWFHEKPTHAIAMLYTTMPAEAFVDGQSVVKSEKADAPVAVGFELAEGAHCLAVRAAFQPYPSWIQFAIRTHKGFYGTAPTWKNKGNPEGDWTQPAHDDTQWPIVGGLGMKGPPDEAYVWMPPNALIDMNAKVTALHGEARLVENNQGFIAFRTMWTHP